MTAIDKIPENVLEKIRKCLALSRSNFENEAATAMRMATALMEQYGLDMAQLDFDDKGQVKPERMGEESTQTRDMFPWEKDLGKVPAYLMPVRHFFQPGDKYGYRIIYVGTKTDAAMASAIYEILRKQLLDISKDEASPRLRRAFLSGCVDELNVRAGAIWRAREASKPKETPVASKTGSELMVVKGKQLDAYMKQTYKLKPCVRQAVAVDEAAYIRGRAAGRGVGLDFNGKLEGK